MKLFKILSLLPTLMMAHVFAQSPVPRDNLKLFASFDPTSVSGLPVVEIGGDRPLGQYLRSIAKYRDDMPVGVIAIGGTADKVATLELTVFKADVCNDEGFQQDVSVRVLSGMTPFDTAEKINKAVQKFGYEVIPTHIQTRSFPPAEVFRFETINGTRSPVVRDDAELATLREALAYSGQEYAEFAIIGGRHPRPIRYTTEFSPLGAEFNKFIEDGQSSLTRDELSQLFRKFPLPGFDYLLRSNSYYRLGARVRFWDRDVQRERTGIYLGLTLTNPLDESDRLLGHAMLTVDPIRGVFGWEKLKISSSPCRVHSVVADVEYDYSSLNL